MAAVPALTVTVGAQRMTFAPDDGPVVIGSGEDATVRIDHELVSRRHGEIVVEDEHWVYRDLGSTNGSYLQGTPIESIAVGTGVIINLAEPDGPAVACDLDSDTTAGSDSVRVSVGGVVHPLDGPGPFVVGRDDAEVAIDDPRVSRRHLEIRLAADGWAIVDTSRNGIFVAGERVTRVVVDEPVTVTLGAEDGPEVVVHAPPVTRAPGRPAAVAADAGGGSLVIGDLRQLSRVHQPGPGTRIGRAADNDIVIDDPIVSRYHAELRGDAATGFEIVDLGSFNGTYLNGQTTSRGAVGEGDLVSVGRSRFLLTGGVFEEYEDTGEVAFEARGLKVVTSAQRTILDEVSFALPEKSVLGVIGPSGAGKSTLVNALTGFRPATEGTVLYDGRDLYAAYDDLRHRIGYVPQDDILHTQLSLRRALDFAARLRFSPDVDAQTRRARVDEVMEELGILHRADAKIRFLSGGQRKRASVAIELLTRPSLIFLDEPTSGLDPGYERALTELLRDLADGGRTIVVVTHSVQSLDLCDRLLVLAPGGAVAYYGPPDQVYDYFGTPNYAEVFRALERQPAQEWKDRYLADEAHEQYVAAPLNQRPAAAILDHVDEVRPARPHGWFRQFGTLVRRNLAVLFSDRRLVLTMLLQAPLLGLVMRFTLSPRELMPLTEQEIMRFSTASIVLAVLVVGVTALGLSNAIREIVKELPIYARERAVGLFPSAYLMSKAAVFGVLTAIQAGILTYIAVQRQGAGWGAAAFEGGVGPLTSGETELMIGMMAGGVAAMALGLLISAGARTVDRAATLVPILLVVQLLFSGAFRDIVDEPGGRQLSWFTAGHWSFSVGASTVDLNRLQNFNDCLLQKTKINRPEDVEFLVDCIVTPRSVGPLADMIEQTAWNPILQAIIVQELTTSELAHRYPVIPEPGFRFWDQTRGDWIAGMLMLTVHIGGALVGAWMLLRIRDRKLMDAR